MKKGLAALSLLPVQPPPRSFYSLGRLISNRNKHDLFHRYPVTIGRNNPLSSDFPPLPARVVVPQVESAI